MRSERLGEKRGPTRRRGRVGVLVRFPERLGFFIQREIEARVPHRVWWAKLSMNAAT